MSHFDWITTLKNWNFGGSPKYDFLLNDGVPPPWLYIGEKADNFGQSIWDNVWCYWELGEPLGNLMETHWEQENNQEIPSFPTPTCKKKIGPSFLYVSLLIGYKKYLFLELFVTISHLS